MIREIKQRICEFVHERNGSKASCKNQIESCLQLIRLCDVARIMNQVESEYEPKTDWIPCEERLPLPKGNEEMVEVDVTVEGNGKNVRVPAFYFFKTCNFHVYGIGGAKLKNVIAWMPKSEPYKKEGAEHE